MRPGVCFLKTSRDISALGYPTCCKTWQDWVTERRGAWRARVNAARLTRGSGSSSWPTVTANEDSYRIGGESQQSKCLSAMASAWRDGRGLENTNAETVVIKLGTGEAWTLLGNETRSESLQQGGKLMAISLNRQVEILRRQLMAKPPRRAAVRLGAAKGCLGQRPSETGRLLLRGPSGEPAGGQGVGLGQQWRRRRCQHRDHKSGGEATGAGTTRSWRWWRDRQSGKLNPQWVHADGPADWLSPSCPSL
jgi:hypothetical protein